MTEIGELEKMERKISEQCTEISMLKQLLWSKGMDPERGKVLHHGPGTRESPKITRVPRIPPRQLKSVVYKMQKINDSPGQERIGFSPTVDRSVPKIPGNGQISLQGVVQDSIYDVTA